ncbi:MAG: hypothetical protein KC588_14170 [Nitrospira sp.]|nr:hypothetical protein [Nitrospira sp.]
METSPVTDAGRDKKAGWMTNKTSILAKDDVDGIEEGSEREWGLDACSKKFRIR